MIRCIAFDLDDTLFNGTLLVEKARIASVQMMIEYGLPVPEDYAIKVLQEIVQEFGSNSENHLDNLILRLQNDPKIQLSAKYNLNKFVAAGIMGYHREKVKHFHPFKDVIRTLESLREQGIKTAIITDGSPKKQYEKILRLKIENLVDEIIISDEVAARKPNTFLFELFLDHQGLQPNEVMYIGDRIDQDITPAKEVGIVTVLIHRGTKYDPNLTKKKYSVNPDYHLNNLHDLFAILEQHAESTP
ncbi:MAG: TIGR02253 family HAD-type hydrolase [Promethearchaeota archaeon]|nr:MAG: TIGR02253 family HAD-type hydrolase [Candidatus Lokiarchaeota archaeon]